MKTSSIVFSSFGANVVDTSLDSGESLNWAISCKNAVTSNNVVPVFLMLSVSVFVWPCLSTILSELLSMLKSVTTGVVGPPPPPPPPPPPEAPPLGVMLGLGVSVGVSSAW